MRGAILAGVLVGALVGCGGGLVQSEEDRLAAEIAAHRWWSKKPTPAEVRGWGKKCSELKASGCVFLDKEGRMTVDVVTHNALLQAPESVKKPFIYVWADPNAGQHMSEASALRSILSDITDMDYRGK